MTQRSIQAADTRAAQAALYLEGDPGDRRFVDWGGDAFHDPGAEEVSS